MDKNELINYFTYSLKDLDNRIHKILNYDSSKESESPARYIYGYRDSPVTENSASPRYTVPSELGIQDEVLTGRTEE